MKKHLRNGSRAAILILVAILCLGTTSRAQVAETAAQIQGQVTDAAGAAVAGATVVVRNDATGEERRAQTNADGLYTVARLNPAVYTVSVEQAGFKKHVESGVTLNAADRRPLNVALETGNVSEVVTVSSETNVVQDTPTQQTLISGTQVLEIPLVNRDFTKLLELVPGVSSDLSDETNFGLTNVVSVSINGMRRNGVNYLVDGVSNTDVGSNITLLSTPTVDSIKEFKVLSSNYTAEIGRSGGGTVTVVTRGGENNFHGSIYDFARNNRFNANTFFNNRRGRNAVTGLPNAPTPRLRYHNFGGTFSGPVMLPRFGEGGPAVWSGRDRTFFFFSHEQRRVTRGITQSVATVPSLAQRAGDFSQNLGAPLFRTSAATPASCTTPGVGTCTTTPLLVQDTGGNAIQARSGMIFNSAGLAYAGNVIPASDFDPRALSLLAAYPLPNTGLNGITFSPVNILRTRQETLRIDHNLNDNHRLFGRYTQDRSETQEPGGLFTGIVLPNIATTDTSVPGKTFVASLTSVLTPTLVNEVTYNYSTNHISSEVVGRSRRSDIPGSSAIPEIFAENNAGVIPTIGITNISTLGSLQGFNIIYKNYVGRDVVTWTTGNHTFKFGGEVSFESKNENGNNITQGSFTTSTGAAGFDGSRTRGTSTTGVALSQTGVGLADFLLGRAVSYQEDERDVTVDLRFGRREFFAQDTWKLRPNLTLDLGVRYQYFLPVEDTNNVLTSFDPALYNRALVPTCANAACTSFLRNTGNELNGIAVAGRTSRFGERVAPADKNNFSPRVGVAWDPFRKGTTVVRAGYGLYYDQPLVGIFEQNAFVNPPFNNRAIFTGTAVTLANPGGGALANLAARSLIANAPDFTTPVIQQWSLGVQHEVFRNAVADLSYVGTKGDHLIRQRDINFVTPQRFFGPQPAGCTSGTTTCINLLRPFVGYGSINYRETSARSRYHGLLSSLSYRFGNGLSLTASYTFSKNLTDSTNDRDAIDNPQNPFNLREEYAEARSSRPHIFAASYVYEIPFFSKDSNGLKRTLLGGWQIAGITNIESGPPIARVVASTTSGGLRGNYPNLVGDPQGGLTGTINTSPGLLVNGLPYIFDPNAFADPALGTFGNAGRAFTRARGRNQTNLTLTKNIYFNTERTTRLQLRAEAFNVFNHTQFLGVQTALGNSNLGLPTSTRLPREFQFGAKLSF
ncbi:MAG: TonB-dependent receptor [Acidobacteria bacterium]|nr:TonB-dependent receptor [Acidobacteriota bacterium]